MCVVHLFEIGNQLLRQLDIAERIAVGIGSPRAGVHLIDVHRLVELVGRLLGLPFLIVPLVTLYVIEAGRVGGTRLEMIAVGVTLLGHGVPIGFDAVLVDAEIAYSLNFTFPHAAAVALVHVIRLGIPVVEIADDRDGLGIGRPCAEYDRTVALTVCTEIFISAHVFTLVKKMLCQISSR